jgi:hypothetical protein
MPSSCTLAWSSSGPRLSFSSLAMFSMHAEADRLEVDPPIEAETARWSTAGQLVLVGKARREWRGHVRGADGRQRWIKAVDLRPASGPATPS